MLLTLVLLTLVLLTLVLLTLVLLTLARVTNARVTNARVTNARVTNARVTNPRFTNARFTNARVTNARVTNARVINARSSSSCVCLSDLETSRGEPGSRVLVQAGNSFSARRRPVLWADIQYVVHCLLWGTTFTDRGVLEAPLQHGRAEPAYTRAKAVEGCPLLSRQVEARDAAWIADEVVLSRRRSCQPIVFPAGPEPGLLRHAWGAKSLR